MEHNIFNINNAGIWDYVRQLAAFNLIIINEGRIKYKPFTFFKFRNNFIFNSIIFKIEQYAYKNTLT